MITTPMDTNGIAIVQPVTGTNTPQHNEAYHKGYFLNDKARVSEIDGIRGLLIHEKPGVVSFRMTPSLPLPVSHPSAGKPNPTTFPFESITLNLKPPLGQASTENSPPTSLTIEGADLDAALQYGPTPGLATFRAWLEDFQSAVHGRAKDGSWTVNIGTGSQDLMAKAFSVVLNPGDPVLIETPVYAGILPPLKNLQAKTIEVEVDDEGISAENLEQILANWPANEKRPRVVYVNPTGCNPSGCSHSRERKLAVLEVCKKYHLLLLEDDPYYYLAQERIPSYFELETEVFPEGGHVLRFDSFSKLLAAGMRLGFASGPKEILHAIDVLTAGACLHSSAVSQAVAYRLVKHWGVEGFLNHAQHVADFYASRRQRFEDLAHKHLDGLAKWVSPTAGMFLWLDLSPAGVKDSYALVRTEALAKGVLAVPGYSFYPNGRKSSHVRTSFSLVDLDQDAEVGMQRLAEAIRDWRKQNGLE